MTHVKQKHQIIDQIFTITEALQQPSYFWYYFH